MWAIGWWGGSSSRYHLKTTTHLTHCFLTQGSNQLQTPTDTHRHPQTHTDTHRQEKKLITISWHKEATTYRLFLFPRSIWVTLYLVSIHNCELSGPCSLFMCNQSNSYIVIQATVRVKIRRKKQSRAQLGGVKTRRNMIWNTALAKGRTSPDDPAWVVGSNSNSKYLFIFEKDACTAQCVHWTVVFPSSEKCPVATTGQYRIALWLIQGNNWIPLYLHMDWGIKCQNPVVATVWCV